MVSKQKNFFVFAWHTSYHPGHSQIGGVTSGYTLEQIPLMKGQRQMQRERSRTLVILAYAVLLIRVLTPVEVGIAQSASTCLP